MRFRPLGVSGMALSAITLKLDDSSSHATPQAWVPVIYAALESGVNSFEVVGRHPTLLEGVAQALSAVERRLVFLAMRLGTTADGSSRDFSADNLLLTLEGFLARTGLEYVDAVVLDDPDANELAAETLDELKAMREAGRTRMLGVAGDRESIDAYIASGAFDLLCTQFNLTSGWKERLRLKAAIERDMAVLGYGYYPDAFSKSQHRGPKLPLIGGGEPGKASSAGYEFLHHTRNWTSEELCLAYALTEPALASVQIDCARPDQIEALAGVPERDLPTGIAAQIEMARFTPLPKVQASKADAKASKARRA